MLACPCHCCCRHRVARPIGSAATECALRGGGPAGPRETEPDGVKPWVRREGVPASDGAAEDAARRPAARVRHPAEFGVRTMEGSQDQQLFFYFLDARLVTGSASMSRGLNTR